MIMGPFMLFGWGQTEFATVQRTELRPDPEVPAFRAGRPRSLFGVTSLLGVVTVPISYLPETFLLVILVICVW